MKSHTTQLEVLHAVASIIQRRAGRRRMLQDVLDLLEADLKLHRGTIMLRSPDDDELMVEATKTISEVQPHHMRYRMGEGVTGRVLETGEAAVIPNISKEPQFRDRIHRRGELSEHGLSFVCVPISVANDVVGTLSVDLYCDDTHALDAAKRVLSTVAIMIANNVQARRIAQTQKRVLEEENLRLRAAMGERLRPADCIEHAVLLSTNGVIHGCHLPPTLQTPDESGQNDACSLKTCVNILERDMITDALKRTQGNVNAASRQLGITPRMTRYKIRKLNIDYRTPLVHASRDSA